MKGVDRFQFDVASTFVLNRAVPYSSRKDQAESDRRQRSLEQATIHGLCTVRLRFFVLNHRCINPMHRFLPSFQQEPMSNYEYRLPGVSAWCLIR
jgi:hypothetical protein